MTAQKKGESRARGHERGTEGWRLRQNKWGWTHQPMRRAEAVGQASGTINQFRIVKHITLVSASIRESVGLSPKTFRPKVVESGAFVERHTPSRSRSRDGIKNRRTSRACLSAASPAPSASTVSTAAPRLQPDPRHYPYQSIPQT